MAVQNSLQKNNGKKSVPMTGVKAFNNLISSDLMKAKIYQMVGRTDAQEFITSITSAVNSNPALAECDSQSIISAALLGQSLHLKPSPQLGYFYMVPYKRKAKYDRNGELISEEKTEAQFQIGYKGYLQLAIRTGEYVDIDAMEIKEGEYLGRNKITGKPQFEFIEEDSIRENLPVVGYMAYFEMKNSYIKQLYWSKEKMINHADKYSQAFSKNGTNGKYPKVSYEDYVNGNYDHKTEWLYSSFWYKNFDEMAKKTMLRQLLSKHALLSTEALTKAVESDMAVIKEDLTPDYIDNEPAGETEEQHYLEETASPSQKVEYQYVDQPEPQVMRMELDDPMA